MSKFAAAPAMRALVLALFFVAGCGGSSGGNSDAGAAGGAGGGQGGGAGGGSGGGGTSASDGGCTFANSGSFNLDLHAVSISGTVTLGGASAPESNPRGAIVFTPTASESSSSDGGDTDGGGGATASPVPAELPATGAATYSTRLFGGIYDVSFVKSGACGAGLLPCGTQLLKSGVVLENSGSLDLDVAPGSSGSAFTVSGTVTKNGAQVPSGARGEVLFVASSNDGGTSDGGTEPASATLPSSGDATYSAQLSAGTYDVELSPPASCSQTSPLPCQVTVLKRALSLQGAGSLDLDATVVQLSGSVTENQQPLANSTSSRGTLSLLDSDGNGPALDLGATGAASFQVSLYAGARDLYLSPPQPCTGPLPCGKHLAASAVPVSVSGSYNLDVSVAQVAFTVTASGAQPGPAAHGTTRGALQLKLGSETYSSLDLGASGAATASAAVYAGSYSIALVNATDCPDGPFPCGTGTLQASAQLTASGAFTVDAKVASVTVQATVNGAAFPTSPTGSPRGTVTLRGPSTVSASLSGTGSASAAMTVYTGSSDILFANELCPDGAAGPAPCQSATLASGRSITASGALPIDLSVADLSGDVTSNGQQLGASVTGGMRGMLLFTSQSAGTVPATLGTSGPIQYRVRLFTGSYQIGFSNATDCPGLLPCQSGTLIAAQSIETSGSLDLDIPVLSLSGEVTLDGQPLGSSGSGASRGTLLFGDDAIDLGTSGAAQYQTHLLRGAWPIRVVNPADCGPNGALPCGEAIVSACP